MATKRLTTTLEIKAVDAAQRVIEGYAAAFNNRDRTGDVIQPGAFDRTLTESLDVIALVGHDASRLPVGEPIEMRADSHGLWTKTRIYQTQDGDDLLAVAQARLASGKTMGMSIGYRTTKDRYAKGNDGRTERHLLDLDLVEYSYLASPDLAANPLAQVTGVKRRHDRHKAAGQAVTIEASYEDLIGDIQDGAADALRVQPYAVRVVATYPDHAIVCVDEDGALYAGQPDDDAQWWDFPYTLDDDGEPVLGDPKRVQPGFLPGASKAKPSLPEMGGYRVEKHGDQSCCADPDGKTIDCHDTHDQAIAHIKELKEKATMPPNVKAEWSAAEINKLPDSAFAYIEPGGHKDDDGKTTPRSLRHFPHHDPDGKVDLPHLRNALARADQDSEFGAKALAHLKRHAEAEGVGTEKSADDAHSAEYADGSASAAILLVEHKLHQLHNEISGVQVAMKHIGLDTKMGRRLKGEQVGKLKELIGSLQEIVDWAESVDRGDDGKARVDWYRGKLALIELEV